MRANGGAVQKRAPVADVPGLHAEVKMKVRYAVTALLALTTAFTVACDDDDDDGTGPVVTPEDFSATLTGAAERPDPVVTTATGSATITFTPASSTTGATGAYSVTVQGLSGPATAAHIHGPGGVDVAAGIIVTFNVTTTSATSGIIAAGTFTSTGHATIDMDSLGVLLRNGNAYVNVHTAANPNGEIRGQIVP